MNKTALCALAFVLIIFLAHALPVSAPGQESGIHDAPSPSGPSEDWDFITDIPFSPEGTLPAPALKEEQQPSVRVKSIAPRRYIVADEPVQVRYEVYVPFRVRIDTEQYRQSVAPFELVAINVSRRFAVPQGRDLEVQRVNITVRLSPGFDCGVYTLPAFRVPYEYDAVSGEDKGVRKGTALADEMEIEKVPLYVDVVQMHDIGFIADVLPFSIEIHADNTAEVLNEYPPDEPKKGIVYLSSYDPDSPCILLESIRKESPSQNYRIISWQYNVAIHDIDAAAFELEVPPVVWRRKAGHQGAGDALPETGIRDPLSQQPGTGNDRTIFTVTPDPVRIQVRSITESKDRFKPLKGVRREPDDERTLLLTVPLTGLLVFSGAALLWTFALSVQFLRNRKKQAVRIPAVQIPATPKLSYDRWPHQRLLVRYKARKAREAFQEEPSGERCRELRTLLTRCAVMRLGKHEQISIREATALTASELKGLAGETPEISDIMELERQLETGEYRKIA